MSINAVGRVLVVDDEPDVLNITKAMLQLGGLEVLTASNGELALRMVQAQRHGIDLVLTDVCMPDMDGRELAKKVREIAPSTRVALMSGALPSEGNELGIPLIHKPFVMAALILFVCSQLAA